MAGDDPDLVVVGGEALLQELDVEHGLGQPLILRHRVDALRAEVVAESLEEGGPGGFLQVDEEEALRLVPHHPTRFRNPLRLNVIV